MDFSSEFLKILESRSHPRFVSVVVWCAGLGIASGALLLVGQLVLALMRAGATGFAWLSAVLAGTSTWSQTSEFLSHFGIAIVIFLVLIVGNEVFMRLYFGPGIAQRFANLGMVSDISTKISNIQMRTYDALSAHLAAAKEKGVDVGDLELEVAQEAIRLRDESLPVLERLRAQTKPPPKP